MMMASMTLKHLGHLLCGKGQEQQAYKFHYSTYYVVVVTGELSVTPMLGDMRYMIMW